MNSKTLLKCLCMCLAMFAFLVNANEIYIDSRSKSGSR